MKFIDITDNAEMLRYPNVMEVLTHRNNRSLPLIAFDGVPLWRGSISFTYLMEELTKRGIEPVA